MIQPKTQPIHIGIILGSTREGRLCEAIANWTAKQLDHRSDVTYSMIDPLLLSLPLHHEDQPSQSIVELQKRLAVADAFLVLTPEYNHSFPAALKFLIDSAFYEWQSKAVGFVGYGGMAGGSRAVEQLRQVFAELHAVTVRNSLNLANAWDLFDDTENFQPPERAPGSLSRVVDQLHWWAKATRDARERRPYSEVA